MTKSQDRRSEGFTVSAQAYGHVCLDGRSWDPILVKFKSHRVGDSGHSYLLLARNEGVDPCSRPYIIYYSSFHVLVHPFIPSQYGVYGDLIMIYSKPYSFYLRGTISTRKTGPTSDPASVAIHCELALTRAIPHRSILGQQHLLRGTFLKGLRAPQALKV